MNNDICWAQVQELKLSAWKVGDRGCEPHSGLQVLKKLIVSSSLTRKYSILWAASVTESVLGLSQPGLEFQIMCPEDSVISFISPSPGGSPGPV